MREKLDDLVMLRAIAIFLVVLGHALPPVIRDNYSTANLIYLFIYNFHMPIFFALSGFLFSYGSSKKISYTDFLLKKLKQLMIPYFMLSIVIYMSINGAFALNGKLSNILNNSGYFPTDFKSSIFQIITYQGHMDKHLWFIYVLFILFIFAPIFIRFNSKGSILGILLICLAGDFAMNLLNVNLPIIMARTINYAFYFCLGVLLQKYYPFIEIKYKIHIILLFILSNCLLVYNSLHMIIKSGVILLILMYSCAILGIASIYFLAVFTQNSLKALKKILSILDEYSYDIYLLHQPFIVAGSIAVLVKFTMVPIAAIIIFATIIGIIVPYVLSKYILKKNKLLGFLLLGRDFRPMLYSRMTKKVNA